MKLNNAIAGRPILAVAVIFALAAGSVQAAPASPKTPAKAIAPVAAPATVVLEYKMPSGRALTYQAKTEASQVMEIQGQPMNGQTNGTSTFTFKSKGLKDKNFLLGVTIDDIVMSETSSMQGDMSPDLSGVKGKSFDMVLSPLGSEVDVAGAEAITYAAGPESRTMAPVFKVFFPDLAGKPVKVGDTWPSTYGFEEKSSGMSIRFDFQNVNTLEGFETIDGMNCAKIAAQVAGTVSGSGNQNGADMTISGTLKGKDIYYFAIKEGIFVKATSESTADMSVDVPAGNMTIPVTGTNKSETKLTAH